MHLLGHPKGLGRNDVQVLEDVHEDGVKARGGEGQARLDSGGGAVGRGRGLEGGVGRVVRERFGGHRAEGAGGRLAHATRLSDKGGAKNAKEPKLGKETVFDGCFTSYNMACVRDHNGAQRGNSIGFE